MKRGPVALRHERSFSGGTLLAGSPVAACLAAPKSRSMGEDLPRPNSAKRPRTLPQTERARPEHTVQLPARAAKYSQGLRP